MDSVTSRINGFLKLVSAQHTWNIFELMLKNVCRIKSRIRYNFTLSMPLLTWILACATSYPSSICSGVNCGVSLNGGKLIATPGGSSVEIRKPLSAMIESPGSKQSSTPQLKTLIPKETQAALSALISAAIFSPSSGDWRANSKLRCRFLCVLFMLFRLT